MGERQCSWSASDIDLISINDKIIINGILSSSWGVNSTSGSVLSPLPSPSMLESSGSTFSLSEMETTMEERRERIERVEAVEIDFLSFLNGRATVFAQFCMDFLRDVALLEIEDLVELVSIKFAIMQNWP